MSKPAGSATVVQQPDGSLAGIGDYLGMPLVIRLEPTATGFSVAIDMALKVEEFARGRD